MEDGDIKFQKESFLSNSNLSEEMAILYSNHYGIWGDKSPKKGDRIKLGAKKLYSDWINNKNSYIATARTAKCLVGYAVAIVTSTNQKEPQSKSKTISWVTQLVVHENYRNRGIAKKLLFSFWGFSNYYAWGILSANPYAIRALESATKRNAIPAKIALEKHKIITFGQKHINYITKETEFIIAENQSKANTNFYSDISDMNDKLTNINQKESPWLMGEIEEGWEWVAFTFNTQSRRKLTSAEIEDLLKSSDEMVVEAYSRMPMDQSSQKWAQHHLAEIDYILNICQSDSKNFLDVGCGLGRHSIELAKRGYEVTGIDYAQELITKAQTKNSDVTFINGDFRTLDLKTQFDVVICLYDIIGSFSNEKDNNLILQNISNHTKLNGYAVISVMNYELTNSIAKYKFDFEQNPDIIYDIPANNIMEKTGDIFNPDYFALDEKTRIVYRREQFSMGYNLQTELIVRDRRYSMDELYHLLSQHGFEILQKKYVRAGDWENNLAATDPKAKEILFVCKKIRQ